MAIAVVGAKSLHIEAAWAGAVPASTDWTRRISDRIGPARTGTDLPVVGWREPIVGPAV